MEEIVYEDVGYKGEPGTLTVNDKVFHYQAHNTKTSVKCSWARVEKRQLSPETAKSHMIKLILISGKSAVFTVKDRAVLEEMRNDMQGRMEAARARADDTTTRSNASDFTKSQRASEDRLDNASKSTKSVNWQDEPIRPRPPRRTSNTRSSTTTHHHHYREEKKSDPCWCCCGTLFCWLLLCCICILIAAGVAALLYWFVFKDSDVLEDVGIVEAQNKSLPPDHGHEERYGIRQVNHEWNSEEVTLSYQLSDYILDNSIKYKLYDGLSCRNDANDITRSNQYLFIDFKHPKDEGPNLGNRGTGTRGPFELHFTLNKGQISDAPFFVPIGLNTAQLNFCIGLSIDYNQVEWWKREKEVNAVETAIQMVIDLSDFRRIDDFAIKTIVRPKYNRLRARA